MMKKLFTFFAFAAVMLSFAACGGDEPNNGPFQIEVTETTPIGASFTITPDDLEADYFWGFIATSQIGSTPLSKHIESFLNDMSLSHDSHHFKKGVFSHQKSSLEQMYLVPNTEYVLYACHFDKETRAIGPIKKATFTTTLPKYYVDLGLPSKTIWNATYADSYNRYAYYLEELERLQKESETFFAIETALPDWAELVKECKWEWVENTIIRESDVNKYNAYKVTGPNGNFIYLPAIGALDENDHRLDNSRKGYYWLRHSSSNPQSALTFDKETIGYAKVSDEWYISMCFVMKPIEYYFSIAK